MNIAIISLTTSFNDANSICQVIRDQIGMLFLYDHNIRLYLLKKQIIHGGSYKTLLKEFPKLKIVPIFPQKMVFDCSLSKIPPKWDADVKNLEEVWGNVIKFAELIITHDLLIHSCYLKYNFSMRHAASKNLGVRWLHWVHSAPIRYGENKLEIYSILYNGNIPRGRIVYPNYFDIPRMAKYFNINPEMIAFIPNVRDILSYFNVSKKIRELTEKYRILDADLIITFPTRLDDGKQPLKAVKMVAALSKLGQDCRLIFADAYSIGKQHVIMKQACRKVGLYWGLKINDIVFTSEENACWKKNVPYEEVKQLQFMSDLLIHTSASEASPLIVAEAALARNLIILNDDFPPLRELYGDGFFYVKFSSTIQKTVFKDAKGQISEELEFKYYLEEAKKIIFELNNNRQARMFRKIRKEMNREYVMKNYFQPLIELHF